MHAFKHDENVGIHRGYVFLIDQRAGHTDMTLTKMQIVEMITENNGVIRNKNIEIVEHLIEISEFARSETDFARTM